MFEALLVKMAAIVILDLQRLYFNESFQKASKCTFEVRSFLHMVPMLTTFENSG